MMRRKSLIAKRDIRTRLPFPDIGKLNIYWCCGQWCGKNSSKCRNSVMAAQTESWWAIRLPILAFCNTINCQCCWGVMLEKRNRGCFSIPERSFTTGFMGSMTEDADLRTSRVRSAITDRTGTKIYRRIRIWSGEIMFITDFGYFLPRAGGNSWHNQQQSRCNYYQSHNLNFAELPSSIEISESAGYMNRKRKSCRHDLWKCH